MHAYALQFVEDANVPQGTDGWVLADCPSINVAVTLSDVQRCGAGISSHLPQVH